MRRWKEREFLQEMKIKETIASLIYFFFPLRERKKKKSHKKHLEMNYV